MALFTADWNPLGEEDFFRRIDFYSMAWREEINLANCMVAIAPFGGPIAILPLEGKIKRTICIFTPNGFLKATKKWSGQDIVCMAWSDSEELIVIQDDGEVFMYSFFGETIRTFSLDREIKENKIASCKVFHQPHGTGIAVMSRLFKFYILDNIKDLRIRRCADIPVTSQPSCWDVISQETADTQIVCAKGTEIFLLDSGDKTCTPTQIQLSNPFTNLIDVAVSWDGSQIAFFTDTGVIWIGKTKDSLKHKYCEFETKSKLKPEFFLWCGPRAVAGLWKNVLLMTSPDKNWLNYVIEGPAYLVQEIDGIRIITNESHEFVEHIPSVVVDIFRIGSFSEGALLLEASKEFYKNSHKADEYIKMLRERDGVEAAVNQCIQAAGNEHRPSTQKMLLRAASFGKSFLDSYDPEPFVKMCQTLRILNAVRHFNVTLPLTLTQLNYLTLPILIDRLILRRNYGLALKIVEYLKIPEAEGAQKILEDWAAFKIRQAHNDDDQIAQDIYKKLGYSSCVSYSDIAARAIEAGRNQLAIKLLEYELRASHQVPLLLKLKQNKQALLKSIESGDTDLIYTVINRMQVELSAGDFLIELRKYPIAHSLYKKYCREEEMEKLRKLNEMEDDHNGEAECWLLQGLGNPLLQTRITCLQAARDSFKKAGSTFFAEATEDELKLIKYQQKMESKFSRKFTNLSVNGTMKLLLQEKEYKLAEELKKEFKVPDTRFWFAKISVLSEMHEFVELEKFSKSKKSPIGYEPFVDACLRQNNRFEAQKYLSKVRHENKIRYYVKAGALEEAAKYAFETKDREALHYILKNCGAGSRTLAEKIPQMMSQI